jgi:hypothetical protein
LHITALKLKHKDLKISFLKCAYNQKLLNHLKLCIYNREMIEAHQKPIHYCKPSPPGAHLIDNPAELAAAFANVVTTPSEAPDDWVARNGDKSIFTAFRIVLPEVSAPPQHC